MDISYLTAKVSTCLAIVSLFFNSYPNVVMGSEQPATKIVQIIENIEYQKDGQNDMAESFDPSPVYIRQGESVSWNNTGFDVHTVTSVLSYGKALFFDQTLKSSDSNSTEDEFNYTFSIPGVFNYYCKEHPYMIGQVIVQ